MNFDFLTNDNGLRKQNIFLIVWLLVFLSHPYSDFQYYKAISIDKWTFLFGSVILLGMMGKEVIGIIKTTSFKYFAAFILWTFMVNGYHGFVNDDLLQYGIKSLIFLSVFLFGMISYKVIRDDFPRTMKYLMLISFFGLLMNAVYISFYDTYVSHGGFFDNQNQLGRFGLAVAVISCLLYHYKKWPLPHYLFSVILGLSAFAAVAEVRRAAILGFCILFIVLIIKYWQECLKGGVVLAVCLIPYYQLSEASIDNHIKETERRFTNINIENGNGILEDRGYKRLLSHPHYLILGAGEGGIDRFEKVFGNSIEVHSILLNILFCYGSIGLLLMFLYYKGLVIKLDFGLLFLLPILAHSVFHNDIKNIYVTLIPILFFFLQKSNIHQELSPLKAKSL